MESDHDGSRSSTPASPIRQDAGGGRFRDLPAVERLASLLEGPDHLRVLAARAEIERARDDLSVGRRLNIEHAELARAANQRVAFLQEGTLRPVLNASGVILHTSLGRAPLAQAAARAAADIASSYCNLEFDLARGARGRREDHIQGLLTELTAAEDGFAVNNNAAATLLAVSALASGGEVIVGRDQLVEIGGSFRIPEILALGGARLVEVGTTNRTRTSDYAQAISAETKVLLRVHQSNFRTIGFTEAPTIEELCELGRAKAVPVIDDLGSGALDPIGDEPVVRRSTQAGALVCFSGDKLLGGPQAGLLVGRDELVARCRDHPLTRAVRLDKLQLAALEATLRLHRDEPEAVPLLAMLNADRAVLQARASGMAATIGDPATVGVAVARVGGGALPTLDLEGPVCRVEPGERGPDALLAQLRLGEPPVVGRIAGNQVILDPRTLDDREATIAAEAVVRALD